MLGSQFFNALNFIRLQTLEIFSTLISYSISFFGILKFTVQRSSFAQLSLFLGVLAFVCDYYDETCFHYFFVSRFMVGLLSASTFCFLILFQVTFLKLSGQGELMRHLDFFHVQHNIFCKKKKKRERLFDFLLVNDKLFIHVSYLLALTKISIT